MEDRTGQWLAGRYRLERRLASDRTGDRYEAWDGAALLGVAVQIFAPALLAPPDARTRVEWQAARVRALAPRGLIGVRALEQDGAATFLVLDNPLGPTLRTVIHERGAPFSPAEAARILRPVADALDVLHDAGIAHRHVSPDTIVIASDGTGILAEPTFVPPGMDAAILGISAFTSPEQMAGQAAEGATDVYALGAVLYEMVTGALPFNGSRMPREAPVGPRTRKPDLPPRLDRVILSALHPDPAVRPASAADWLADSVGNTHDMGQRTTALVSGEDATAAITHLGSPSDYASVDEIGHTGMVAMPQDTGAHVPVRRRGPVVPALAVLTAIVLLSAVVLGVLVVRRNQTISQQQDSYVMADAALARGDYDAAIAEFSAAGTYRDASARAQAAQVEKEQRANYDMGVAAFDREDFPGAADAFGKAGTFRDAPQRRAAALRLIDQQQAYGEGVNALAKEDYPAAATDFARAGDYKDAPKQALDAQTLIGQQRQYQAGQDAFAREDYSTAAAAFRAVGTYMDAPVRATQAEKLASQKAAYDAGATAFAQEDYKTAKQQFQTAGDYKDAAARAAQSDQEDMLLARYTSAQDHLRASQWKEAYADLQEVNKIRPNYKDVGAILNHLENDVVNPTMVDIFGALNQGNGYKEGWVPVNNLIGQPVTWLYIVSRSATEGRPDQISAVAISLVAKQGTREALNTDIPVLAVSSDLKDRNTLRNGEQLFVVSAKGQTFEAAEFGKYRVRLTVTNVTLPSTATFPTRITGGTDSPPLATITPTVAVSTNTGSAGTAFGRLTLDVTLTPKTP